ncbi:MAG TPA: hypothetical protein VIY73_07590 [Polyangiaceae bacterium]
MTTSPARRINARLPADVARKVAYLERTRKKSTTQVVVESIEHYYEAVAERQGSAAERLERAGFVGCARGAADLSATYEEDLAASIGKKT